MWVLYDHFVCGGELVQGWTSLMSAITIFGTIELLMFGIFGEYLGRTYEQVKQRPLYIIADLKRGNSSPAPHAGNNSPETESKPDDLGRENP